MRTPTTQQTVALNGTTSGTSGLTGSPAYHMRVQVKDSGGTWRDLTTYPGVDMVESAEWGESTDDPGASATITLLREQDAVSLAPLMQASPLNVAFTPGGSYNALVFVGRQVRIDVAIVAADMQPVSSDWNTFFHGYIDRIEPAGDGRMTLECRDLMAAVIDAYIEEDRVYGLGRDGSTRCGCRVWEPSRNYVAGEYVVPSDGKSDAAPYIYKATSVSGSGISSVGEPSWPTVLTNTVTDNAGANQIVWTCTVAVSNSGETIEDIIQAMLNNNMSSPPTLSQLDGPMSWTLGWFKQARQGLNQALRTLVNQAGWDIRYRWDSGSAAFVLSTKKFTRSGASVNYTFGPTDYTEVRAATIDNSTIRNVVRIIYSDASDLDANKTPRRYSYTASDSSSITKYGRRFMEVSESSTSAIDSQAEAITLANAIRDDLKEPTMELGVELALGFPFVEVGDTYRFSSNGRHFDTTQTLAVWSYRHRAANGALSTSLTCRGSPGLGPELWGGLDGRIGTKHSLTHKQGTTGFKMTASPTVGGARISINTSDAVSGGTGNPLAFPSEYEVHISTSPGFTPSASTLKSVMQGSSVEVGELIPGTTYYYKAVQRIRNAGRMTLGLPSTENSFVAGQGKARHLQTEVEWGRLPLNGGFETSVDGTSADHWTATSGSWGDTFIWETSSSSVTGTKRLKLVNANNQNYELLSSYIEVESERDYRVSLMAQYASTANTNGWNLYVESYNNTKTWVSTSSALVLDASADVWAPGILRFTTGSSVKYVRLAIRGEYGTSPRTAYVDDIRLERVPDYWYQSEDSASSRSISSATWSSVLSESNDLRGGLPVFIALTGSCYSNAVAKGEFRINFGGTAQAARAVFFNEASEHQQFAFVWVVSPANNPGGSVTITADWRSPDGTSTISQDSNDSLSMAVFELPYGRG